jgi:hypothetical protein
VDYRVELAFADIADKKRDAIGVLSSKDDRMN